MGVGLDYRTGLLCNKLVHPTGLHCTNEFDCRAGLDRIKGLEGIEGLERLTDSLQERRNSFSNSDILLYGNQRNQRLESFLPVSE